MFLYKAICIVLIDLFDRYAKLITINLIVMVGPCLATVMLSEEKADS